MVIEKLKLEDIEGLLELYKELTPFENSLEKSIEIYKEILQDEQYLIIAAKENNKIIGSALGVCCKCLSVGGNPFLVIEDVIINEDVRGQGVGKKIMTALDEFAKEKNCDYAILVSSDYRKGAHVFYENLGFIDGVRGFRKMYTD
ncbi:N-acetyltransferase [Clostridium gelidum]|uniref:N-acetyltransferase n=1 Tax=Clostridium gelidum TaxID=704125 RepID=A0ABM7T6X6_9CLOT|nr:GNAT family N-acetyltransferase [Clostridium gelidum]BCZ47743.1 N-acetyltransferase [Clostridium gelidum]